MEIICDFLPGFLHLFFRRFVLEFLLSFSRDFFSDFAIQNSCRDFFIDISQVIFRNFSWDCLRDTSRNLSNIFSRNSFWNSVWSFIDIPLDFLGTPPKIPSLRYARMLSWIFYGILLGMSAGIPPRILSRIISKIISGIISIYFPPPGITPWIFVLVPPRIPLGISSIVPSGISLGISSVISLKFFQSSPEIISGLVQNIQRD